MNRYYKKKLNSLFKKIRKQTLKEREALIERLIVIYNDKRAYNDKHGIGTSFEDYRPTTLDIEDIEEAFIFCLYHFTGQRIETKDNNEHCPCRCYCQNCEMIPETPVLIRMQDLGQNIKEEDVLIEYIKELDEEKTIGQSSKTCDTNDVISNS